MAIPPSSKSITTASTRPSPAIPSPATITNTARNRIRLPAVLFSRFESPLLVGQWFQYVAVGVGSVVAERGFDGSRGLQPTEFGTPVVRRGATLEGCVRSHRSFSRRSATRLLVTPAVG